MTSESRFDTLADQWIEHCEATVLSSNIRDYLDHPSYRDLVSMGHDAIPDIMERYENDSVNPWGFLLEDITGLGIVDDHNRFDPDAIRQRWLNWWRANGRSFERNGGNQVSAEDWKTPEQTR